MLRVCQECAALDSVVANRESIHGILMKGSNLPTPHRAPNRHSFLELGLLLEIKKNANYISVFKTSDTSVTSYPGFALKPSTASLLAWF